MQIITCLARVHRGEERIFIASEYGASINAILKKIPGIKWSQTQKQWHIPLDEKGYKQFCKSVAAVAEINSTLLKEYLQERKGGNTVVPESAQQFKPAQKKKLLQEKISKTGISLIKIADAPQQILPALTPGRAISNPPLPPSHQRNSFSEKEVTVKPAVASAKISGANKHALTAFKQHLVLKAYSPSTVKTYLNEMSQFVQELKGHAAEEFTPQRLKDYLQYCFEHLHLSENTLHSRMNALKFYYEQVLSKEKFFWEIPRPKKPALLPKLLNEDELRKLFNTLKNKKHKAMLFTAYSAGLRVSEIVNLKIADVDSKRMQLFIARAKGKKDRYVNLSPLVLDILRKYLVEYNPRPKIYLFESETSLGAYPTRTVQQIFSAAKHKAGISKAVGVHSLRHSFATHLLDKGTDIKYIKDLLGHFNIKTTERYLHVSKKQLVNIISPFDDLWKTNTIDW